MIPAPKGRKLIFDTNVYRRWIEDFRLIARYKKFALEVL